MFLRRALIALAAFLLIPSLSYAGPLDARVGETRVAYAKAGTPLREEAKALAKPLTTLPSGARIVVREVRFPWLRIEVLDGSRLSGWLRASETVEPAALSPNPGPSAALRAAPQGVNPRDVSAAGRQFGPSVESGYRRARPDLQHAYALVDRMEQDTRRMDPAESVAFITGGVLGQRGQDYVRPGILPPTPPPQTRRDPRRDVGRVLGGILDRVGPGGRVGDALKSGAQELPGLFQQLSENFTPEQEYFLGRAVAANAIARYGIDPDERRRAYVRSVGDAIVRLSRRVPPNAAGYHFDVLASDEVNAVSGPGGFVLVTRGAVESCQTEDELAAIVAHELAHVTKKHGERTLREGKDFQATLGALSRVGAAAGGVNDSQLAGRLLEVFTKAVGQMVQTSVEHNYGRGAEFESDLEGTYLLVDVVYDHHAMPNVLGRLEAHPHAFGRAATHASARVRRQQLAPTVARYGAFPYGDRVLEARRARFKTTLGR